MLTTLTPPCQKCYKPAMETRGGGDCVDCNKFFCEKDSIKIKVGEMEGKTLYGVRCKDCDDKRPCGHCPAHCKNNQPTKENTKE